MTPKWFALLICVICLFAVVPAFADCAGSQVNGYIATDATFTTRIPGAGVDIYRKDFGFWYYRDTVWTENAPGSGEHGRWVYCADDCAEYKAQDVAIPYAFTPCTLNRSEQTWEWQELGYPHPWYTTGANFYCL